MAAVTFTEEFTTTISAPRMFKALIVDGDNLIPKLIPQAFKSVETVEGDGGVGSIKKINFAEGNPLKYVKHRVEAFDKESMSYSYTLVEVGDGLLDKFISISYDVKFEPTSDGGCIAKNVSKYLPKAGVEMNEEEIKAAKEKAKGISKAVEAYLLANPHAYA